MKDTIKVIVLSAMLGGALLTGACGGNNTNTENAERESTEERDFGAIGADPSSGTVVSGDSATATPPAEDSTDTEAKEGQPTNTDLR